MKNISKKVIVGVIGLTALGSMATSAYAFERPNLTDEQKTGLEQIRELRSQGDIDGAKALAESLGLRQIGGMKGFRGGDKQNHEEIEKALENSDFASFKELTKDAPFADKLTEDMFSKLQEAHTLRQAGKFEEAKTIMQDLGINPPMGHGEFQRQQLTDEQKSAFEKAHALIKSGDKDGAKQTMKDAGIKRPKGPRF